MAKRWCELVEREQEIQTRGNWLFEQVANLRHGVQEVLPEAWVALSKFGSVSQPVQLAATSVCLQRALVQLCETLNLPSVPSEAESLVRNTWEWLPLRANNLLLALNRRLLWFPEIPLTDSGEPASGTALQIALAIRDALIEGRSLYTAFEKWVERQDYRFIEMLLDAPQKGGRRPPGAHQYQEALNGSRAALRDDINQTVSVIEQGVVDGIIAEERSEYSATVAAINPDETLNFSPKHTELELVREGLANAHRRRLAELLTEWQNLQPLLAARIEPTKWERGYAFVQAALDRNDTRVVEECLARLTEALEVGGELEGEWFGAPAIARDVLREFLQVAPRMEELLGIERGLQTVIDDIRQGRSFGGISFGELSPERREEAATALGAWRD